MELGSIHDAAANGDLEIVEQLVGSGADVNVTSEIVIVRRSLQNLYSVEPSNLH